MRRIDRGVIEDREGWLFAAIAVFSVAGITVLGSLLWFGIAGILALGVIVGASCALVLGRFRRSVGVLLAGLALGGLGITYSTSTPWGSVGGWLLFVAQVGSVATFVAGVTVFVGRRNWIPEYLLRAATLAILFAIVWFSALSIAAAPPPEGGGAIAYIDSPAQITSLSYDEDLHLAYIQGSREGYDHYATVREVLTDFNSIRGQVIDTGSPASFRMPTLYVLLGVAGTGFRVVVLALLLVTASLISAYLLAATYVRFDVAMLGVVGLATYLVVLVSTRSVVNTELWAGMLVLVSLAFAASLWSRSVSEFWMHAAAAAIALAATVTRELAAAVMVLGLAGTLADAETRKARAWAGWLAGLVVFAGIVLLHVRLVAPHLVPVSGDGVGIITWFHPDGLGLVAAVEYLSRAIGVAMPVAWALFLGGAVGSVLAPRRTVNRVLLGGVALGGCLALALFHPPGEGAGQSGVVGTWGMLVTPSILALSVLALVSLPTVARRDTASESAGPES